MKNRNLVLSSVGSTSMILILALGVDSVPAHERRLYTIGDQDYLFVVGLNE
ncbi:MAG: hypothetical protein WA941_05210 [Nitrososphaeraceae archaeon]